MNGLPNREVSLFSAALELPALERTAYLDQACADDPALRQRLEALLADHDKAVNFLEVSAAVVQEPPPGAERPGSAVRLSGSPAEKAGDRIGRYKLLQQIGEGGCGVVYMAEQEEPVRRRVALKVIKLGMDTKQVVARFEAERQALALMDHPNIAKVFDAGATNTGRPYFVMELVRGLKVTDYCAENNLSARECLGLFVQVCQALQHAHQKGIIHRDIKPSNILVTVNDGLAVPKVIDFGIAKATQGRLTDYTLFTAFEQFIGTPAYMSPEQAVMTSLDVDTRSDIYSLGVLLYELLTGHTPFDTKILLAAGVDEMRRTIREVQPLKPSTRLTQERLATRSAGSAKSEFRTQISKIDKDLDWIVMKCLEKDRARRYETANGLANDIQRHLNCEPVVARPPSRLYEFQKTVRRHKFGFGAAAALIMVLGAGALVSTLETIRAKRAERFAETARVAESEQRSEAERQRRYAEANFQKARKTVDEYFTTISETSLLDAPGLRPLRKQLLEAALAYYQGFLEHARDDPELLADLATAHLRLSVVYVSLDRNDDALAAMLQGLALVERSVRNQPGNTDLSRRLAGFFKISGDVYSQTHPPSDPIKAVGTLQKAAAIWEQFARDDPATLEFQGDLAGIYALLSALCQNNEDFDQSIEYALRARAILEKVVRARPAVAAYQDLLLINYGYGRYSLDRKGRIQEADEALRQGVRYFVALFQQFPAELSVRRSLAKAYIQLADALQDNRPSEAENFYHQALDLLESQVVESPGDARCRQELYANYNRLTELLLKAGRKEEAQVLAAKALLINEQLVLEFPGTADYSLDLSKRYLGLAQRMRESQPSEAAQEYRRALAVLQKLAALPHASNDAARGLLGLGNAALQDNSLDFAESAFRLAAPLLEQVVAASPSQPQCRLDLNSAYGGLSEVLWADNRIEESTTAIRQAIATLDRALADFPPKQHPFLEPQAHDHRNLGYRLGRLKQYAAAREAFSSATGFFRECRANASLVQQATALEGEASDFQEIGELWSAEGHPREAREAYRQSLTNHQAIEERDFAKQITPGWVDGHYIELDQVLNKVGTPEDAVRLAPILHPPAPTASARGSLALARCHVQLGALLQTQGQAELASHEFASAEQLLSACTRPLENLTAATDPNGAKRKPAADACLQLSERAAHAAQPKLAERAAREAITLFKQLAQQNPKRGDYAIDLGHGQKQLVEVWRGTNHREQAEPLLREVVQAFEKGIQDFPNQPLFGLEKGLSLRQLGDLLAELGRGDEAEREYHEAIKLYVALEAHEPKNGYYRTEVAHATWGLANVLRAGGNRTEATATALQAAQKCHVEVSRYEEPESPLRHPDWCWNFANLCGALGVFLEDAAETQEAEKTFRDAQALWANLVADSKTEDYRFHLACNSEALGNLLQKTGRAAESLRLYGDAQALWLRSVAELNSEDRRFHLANNYEALGNLLVEVNQTAESLEAYRQAVSHWRKLVGEFNKDDYRHHLSRTLTRLAETLRTQGKVTDAEALERELAERGDAQAMNELAWRLATAADAKLRDGSNAVVCAEKACAATSRTNASLLDTLAAAYAEAGRFDRAIGAQQEAIRRSQNEPERTEMESRLKLYQNNLPYRDHGPLAELTQARLVEGKFVEAEGLARECLILREREIPNDWRTFNARSMLGGALLGQQKYADAELLLISSYEGLKQRENGIPAQARPRLQEALQRIVQLYGAGYRPDQAAGWKQKLELFKREEIQRKSEAAKEPTK